MSTTLVPIDHYLQETWQPDREYVPGTGIRVEVKYRLADLD
jgi:hypothetical protein